MGKKKHLAIQEIYKYQAMSFDQIVAELEPSKAVHYFHLMLQSFKITARVANAAWGVFEMLRTEHLALSPATEETLTGLGRALSDYSLDNFQSHRGDVEFAADCFEQFYNEAMGLSTKEEVAELLYQWTVRLKTEATSHGTRTPVT